MRQFMMSQPKVLEEAAADGWRAATGRSSGASVCRRSSRPALSALGIITFTQTWNYYLRGLKALLGPQNAMTLPLAMDILRGYLGQGNLAVVMAAMSIAVLPVILLFLLAPGSSCLTSARRCRALEISSST